MHRIFSGPQGMWVKQARRYLLEVQDCINETFANGPWLDSMISLKNELAQMGGVVEDKIKE